MNKVSGFSDNELLVMILSFLPTKVAVSTSILSKQWKFLWMRVSKLDYDEMSLYTTSLYARYRFPKEGDSIIFSLVSKRSERMRRFIDKNLPLHSSPIIESLRLKTFTVLFQPEDIKSWVEIAVLRWVKELSVNILSAKGQQPNALLPSSLYTCKSLVTLKLMYIILVDVPHVCCLPSLKTLHLNRVTYANEESLQRLLSNCSVLEDLILNRRKGDNVRKFAVIIPSLLSLTLTFSIFSHSFSDGYVIDTPSLKCFNVTDFSNSSSCLIANMPKLEEAHIHASGFHKIKKLLEPVTSVKCLSLGILDNSAEGVYGDDIVFNELEHLRFSTQKTYWSKLLLWLLNASPKLRDLTFDEISRDDGKDTVVCWKQLISVPQCLLSSLQKFRCSGYHVSTEGRDLATYILRNSCRLKTAIISIGPDLDPQKKLEIETEMKFSSRGSPTCNLVFDENLDWKNIFGFFYL